MDTRELGAHLLELEPMVGTREQSMMAGPGSCRADSRFNSDMIWCPFIVSCP